MFLSILDALDTWWRQMKDLTSRSYDHLTPQDYTVMLFISLVSLIIGIIALVIQLRFYGVL